MKTKPSLRSKLKPVNEDFKQEATLMSYMRGNSENRFWAKLIDLCILQFCAFLISLLSGTLAFLFLIAAWSSWDRISHGQSPGKWLFGLQVLNSRTGQIPTFYSSFIRNIAFFCLNWGLLHYSQSWAAILLALSFCWIGMEMYFIFQIRTGIRVGDIQGGSRVYDFKDKHTRFLESYLQENDISLHE